MASVCFVVRTHISNGVISVVRRLAGVAANPVFIRKDFAIRAGTTDDRIGSLSVLLES